MKNNNNATTTNTAYVKQKSSTTRGSGIPYPRLPCTTFTNIACKAIQQHSLAVGWDSNTITSLSRIQSPSVETGQSQPGTATLVVSNTLTLTTLNITMLCSQCARTSSFFNKGKLPGYNNNSSVLS